MPQDSIYDMVNNIESLYNDLQGLYRKWTRDLDAAVWSEPKALKEATALAAHFAEAIETTPHIRGKYSPADFRAAAEEMVEEWKSDNEPDKSAMGGSRKKTLQSVEAHRDFMQLGTPAWFDFLNALAGRLGQERFREWLIDEVTPWKVRSKAIDAMAWNDRNSTWYLDHENILKTRQLEGDPVTAEMVADSLMSMLDIGAV